MLPSLLCVLLFFLPELSAFLSNAINKTCAPSDSQFKVPFLFSNFWFLSPPLRPRLQTSTVTTRQRRTLLARQSPVSKPQLFSVRPRLLQSPSPEQHSLGSLRRAAKSSSLHQARPRPAHCLRRAQPLSRRCHREERSRLLQLFTCKFCRAATTRSCEGWCSTPTTTTLGSAPSLRTPLSSTLPPRSLPS